MIDVLCVFGDSGSGKTSFALWLAQQVGGEGTFWIDTERNCEEDSVPGKYVYTPLLDELKGHIDNIPPQTKLVVVDSVGMPVLARYAELSQRERGQALMDLIGINARLKEWAYRSGGIAVVTTQPQSEMGLKPGETRRPFGEKAQYAAKEIWWMEPLSLTKGKTMVEVQSYRSRRYGRGRALAIMTISDRGVSVRWKVEDEFGLQGSGGRDAGGDRSSGRRGDRTDEVPVSRSDVPPEPTERESADEVSQTAGGPVIDQEQAQLLYSYATGAFLTEEQVKARLAKQYGVESALQLTEAQYAEIMRDVEKRRSARITPEILEVVKAELAEHDVELQLPPDDASFGEWYNVLQEARKMKAA